MTQQKNCLVIGLAGLGTVGQGVLKLLHMNQDLIERRIGRSIVVKKVLVHSSKKKRALPEGTTLTTDLHDLTDDPEIEAVIEVIGGLDTAKTLIERALDQGKHIVTANKALLAEQGAAIFAKAREKNRIVRYEASVAGAIPIVETLKESLAADSVRSLMGILNGTSNYILSEMSTKKLDFATALKQAQELGFAEADPSFDIDGIDAAHKLVLLIRLAFGAVYPFKDLKVQGIRNLSSLDISLAEQLGYNIKLIGEVHVTEKQQLQAGVYPALVHKNFMLARVEGAFNAVYVQTNAAGSLFFHGQGAGSLPTASAVVADLLAIARGGNRNNTGFCTPLPTASIQDPSAASSCYYVRMMVEDFPGVLRDIAGCMAAEGINMSHVIQRIAEEDIRHENVPLVIMTHETSAFAMRKALEDVVAKHLNKGPIVSFRVLNEQKP